MMYKTKRPFSSPTRSNSLHHRVLAPGLLLLALFWPFQDPASAQNSHSNHEDSSGHHEYRSGVDHWLPRLEDPDRDTWQKPGHVVKYLALSDGMNVVDLGAGTGYFLGHLALAVGEEGSVLGLDIDQELVDYMTQRAKTEGWNNVDARVIPTDDPGLPPESVDRILIVNTWHHLQDRGTYARRLAAALKPGGRICVIDLTMDSPHGPPSDHRLPIATVMKELEASDLLPQVIDEDLPYQYVVIAEK